MIVVRLEKAFALTRDLVEGLSDDELKLKLGDLVQRVGDMLYRSYTRVWPSKLIKEDSKGIE